MLKFKDDEVITATAIGVLDETTFVAKKQCSDTTITCPATKGLLDLGVKSDGSIIKKFPRGFFSPIPPIGTELAIFTLTNHWVPVVIWDKVSWAINASRRFRAFAHNRKHISGGRVTELATEEPLTSLRGSTLMELVASSIRGAPSDTFAEKYSYGIQKNGGTMQYETRWEMFEPHKKFWISWSDPRPIGKFEFEP